MTADITRLFRDQDKQYHGLVHQQGRLPMDAEENHGADIAQWSDERRFVETIAPSGSPDNGFKISLAGGAAPVNFHIAAGSYYLGGARVENAASLDYRDQRNSNWLTFHYDAEQSNEAIGSAKKFIVWLDAREALVTATEDSELLEPGLGGPDGAARKRFAWHVRATPIPDAYAGCISGAEKWLDLMGWTGLVDPGTGLLASGATLTVSFNPADVDQDLCQPSLTPGFLGARNECFRVMVTRAGHYVWSQDDAAPLYRVRVEDVGGQKRRFVFVDPPRDEYARPRAGHTVELLRWDQLLPNRQKTAEAMGKFFTVSSGFVDNAIQVSNPVDADWITWLNNVPVGALGPQDDPQYYYYLRVWTGGGQGTDPDIPFATADLPGTGLTLAFAGTPMPGEAWAIAARPNAPAQVMPWALLGGMAAHAPRRHVVPLAYVDLDAMTVIDCRRRFRPLYKIGGCCTVTVGDGVKSWGDVSTIAAAVALLPPSGGEICIGPGNYEENVSLNGRDDIIFTGCGARTVWTAHDPALPLLDIRNCNRITVRRLRMVGGNSQCIAVDMPGGAPAAARNSGLSFEDLELVATSGSAIFARRLQQFALRRSNVTVGPFPSGPPPAATSGLAAVFLRGEQLTVERSRIAAPLGAGGLPSQRPLGGLHFGGGSRDIIVLRNEIEAGNGNGITLGSVHMVVVQTAAWAADPVGAFQQAAAKAYDESAAAYSVIWIDSKGCIHIGWPIPTPGGGGTIELPVSDGIVENVRIEKNRIADMGGNGIATFPMHVLLDSGEVHPDAVAVDGLLVLDNRITGSVLLEPPPLPNDMKVFTGFGGIALNLAFDVTLRDNQIDAIGLARAEGVCGIFIGYGEDVRIERNRIENLGALPTGGVTSPSGGIVIRLVVGGVASDDGGASGSVAPRRTRDRPALLIQNNIVHARYARAIRALALGPVMIEDNRLTGANPSLFFTQPLLSILILFFGGKSIQDLLNDPNADLEIDNFVMLNLVLEVMGGDAVNLVNLGLVEELLLTSPFFAYARKMMATEDAAAPAPTPPPPPRDHQPPVPALLRGGETMFANNQVSLHSPTGQNTGTVSSVLVLTSDDLCFADNQLEVEADLGLAVFDALLLAVTLRATGNRAQEAAPCLVSLLSWAWMNTTTSNQTTFFLVAEAANPAKRIQDHNLSLVY